jgi:hypothetical protein
MACWLVGPVGVQWEAASGQDRGWRPGLGSEPVRSWVLGPPTTGRSRAACGLLPAPHVRRLVGRGGLCRSGQDREAPSDRVEEGDLEGRLGRPFTGSSPRRSDRGEVCRRGVEEDLEGCGAAQALVRPEAEIVEQGELQALLDVLDGERELQATQPGQVRALGCRGRGGGDRGKTC